MQRVKLFIFGVLLILVVATSSIYIKYGGGSVDFPNRSSSPAQDWSSVELVANLDTPPGNIAVSEQGRIFLSQHPEARPEVKIIELVNGVPLAFPNTEAQSQWHTPLGVRIDQQQRLWVLDAGEHGFKSVTLIAYDLTSNKQVHYFEFPSNIMGLGSHANDLQVSQDGKIIYIADASILSTNPGIIIYNVEKQLARRVLSSHHSVIGDKYTPQVQGRVMSIGGIFDIRPGVDSIALDRQNQWLYFAPITEEVMYRISTKALLNQTLSDFELSEQIEVCGEKTMSDGITIDHQGRLYLSDLENSAIVRMNQQGKLTTLLKDLNLRWPDGFSFGADGWLYITCSSLQDVIGRSSSNIKEKGPYQVYRFKPDDLQQSDKLAGH